MECTAKGCRRDAEEGKDECFRHRILGVGFSLRAPAVQGDWHRSTTDWKLESFGETSDKKLEERGIVKASEYGWR